MAKNKVRNGAGTAYIPPAWCLGLTVGGCLLVVMAAILALILWLTWPINPVNLNRRLQQVEQQLEQERDNDQ